LGIPAHSSSIISKDFHDALNISIPKKKQEIFLSFFILFFYNQCSLVEVFQFQSERSDNEKKSGYDELIDHGGWNGSPFIGLPTPSYGQSETP
jgi:hypothetical protein